MSPTPATPPSAPTRRWLPRLLLALVVALALVVVATRIVLHPERSVPMILDRLGGALGLQLTAGGQSELVLRGTPTLVVRDLVARQPGAGKPVLTADRVLLSLPWSTIRDRGRRLELTRIELDGPTLDLPALRRWLSSRPPGESRMPSLGSGLRVRKGRVDAIGWHAEGLSIDVPRLHAGAPLQVAMRGRFVDQPTQVPFDLVLAMTRPAPEAGVAVAGTLDVQRRDWRLPARILWSGPMRWRDGVLMVAPSRLASSGAYVSGDRRLPWVLGLHGPLRYADGIASLAPAGVALRGESPLPTFDGLGALALGGRLLLRLDGVTPGWPAGWPSLPPPLSASTSPVPLRLDYLGRASLADVARLRLRRDAARFDGSFRVPEVLAWIDDGIAGHPLPPLSGKASAPVLEISGARLEGVEIDIVDPRVPMPPTVP
ncbi:hypothetical protein [Luteimonas vadosa]|uniref:AsmA family protein n=1 Tax=Luteimonas vadosa TaxID=1165507 RepID=A0ABP9E644_9GAMM